MWTALDVISGRLAWDIPDLRHILGQARENQVSLKCYGGTFPIHRDSTDILLSLSRMKRMLSYQPEEKTFHMETGLTLGEALARMEYLNCTLKLYGTVPDMSLHDAIAVGLLSSNGSISDVIDSCQVIQPDLTLNDWFWPNPTTEEEPEEARRSITNSRPNLQALVSGLGFNGIISSVNLKSVQIHKAQEVSYECDLNTFLNESPKLWENLYTDAYWFPLIDKVLVTTAFPVRINNVLEQPWWKMAMEYIYRGFYWLINRASYVLTWHIPSLARWSSTTQFNFLSYIHNYRFNHSFRPYKLESISEHCRGIFWWLPGVRLSDSCHAIERWSQQSFELCTTPVRISLHHHPDGADQNHRPFMAPYSASKGITIWADWFNASSLSSTFNAPMGEFEALLQRQGGRRCWSAGPLYVSPLIGNMYPGYKNWTKTHFHIDPNNMFISAYIEGEILPEKITIQNRGDISRY